MFKVTIHHPQQGQAAIKFETESRKAARAAAIMGEDAGIEVEVVREVKPAPVKFRGINKDA